MCQTYWRVRCKFSWKCSFSFNNFLIYRGFFLRKTTGFKIIKVYKTLDFFQVAWLYISVFIFFVCTAVHWFHRSEIKSFNAFILNQNAMFLLEMFFSSCTFNTTPLFLIYILRSTVWQTLRLHIDCCSNWQNKTDIVCAAV